MLNLLQGIYTRRRDRGVQSWTPKDLLSSTNGADYWWRSGLGLYEDDGTSTPAEGEVVGVWQPYKHIGNTTTRFFVDASATGKDFLYNKGYVYSEDGENSKFTLYDTVGGSAQEFSIDGDFYMCFRVRLGTFTTGADALWQDLNNTSKDFLRVQDTDTLRLKINNGTNRNFNFDGFELTTDTWYNIEIQRGSNQISVFVDGLGSDQNAITDSGTITLDRIFAVSDGHISDFLILDGRTLGTSDRTKLRNYLSGRNDYTYAPGGLST